MWKVNFVDNIEQYNDQWLQHLKDSIPEEARGYTLSMYCIALEGWRRGMTLKFNNINSRKSEIKYTLTFKGEEHSFVVSRGDMVTREAMKICKYKSLTKDYLSNASVPVPEGKAFEENTSDEELSDYAKKLGYPLVLKPVDGTGGRGVIANIKSKKEFKEALSFIKYDLGYKRLIIERYFSGKDYRVYVVKDKVLAVLDRIPANVLGNGKDTVRELLRVKNNLRGQNPALDNRPIKIDKEMYSILKSQGHTLKSIPKANERVYLKSKNNISAGGDSVDLTDRLPDNIKNIAIEAVKAIPGLVHGGVDLMVNLDEGSAVVLEVNSQPAILSHMFPMIGQSRDIPKAIIDMYFPDSKADYSKPAYYFGIENMWDSFQNGVSKEYVIPDKPRGDLKACQYLITGKVAGVGFENWMRRNALKQKLNGYVKLINDGEMMVVVSGPVDAHGKLLKLIRNNHPKKATISNITEKDYNSPVKIGFEIINMDSVNTSQNDTLINKELNNTKLVEDHKVNKSEKQNSKPENRLDNGYFPVLMKKKLKL